MMNLETRWAKYENLYLVLDRYVADGSLAIRLWNDEDGPIANLTVCLDDQSLKENESYLDVNNLPEAVSLIEDYGLGKITDTFRWSGYCVYPCCEFNMEALEKYEKELAYE